MLHDLLAPRPLETNALTESVHLLAHAARVPIPAIDLLLQLLLQRSRATV